MNLGAYVGIGGGATPFLPALELEGLRTDRLTQHCQRQTAHRGRQNSSRRLVHFSPEYSGSYRLGQLFCRTGYHLQIHHNGRVNGTKRDDSHFGVLEFLSVAFGLVSIRGQASRRYLCMSRNGKLYGAVNPNQECVFMEQMLKNFYNTYSSCTHSSSSGRKRWYLAINRRGKTRIGSRTKKKKKYTHFLVMHLEEDWRVGIPPFVPHISPRAHPFAADSYPPFPSRRRRPPPRPPSRFGSEAFAAVVAKSNRLSWDLGQTHVIPPKT